MCSGQLISTLEISDTRPRGIAGTWVSSVLMSLNAADSNCDSETLPAPLPKGDTEVANRSIGYKVWLLTLVQ